MLPSCLQVVTPPPCEVMTKQLNNSMMFNLASTSAWAYAHEPVQPDKTQQNESRHQRSRVRFSTNLGLYAITDDVWSAAIVSSASWLIVNRGLVWSEPSLMNGSITDVEIVKLDMTNTMRRENIDWTKWEKSNLSSPFTIHPERQIIYFLAEFF